MPPASSPLAWLVLMIRFLRTSDLIRKRLQQRVTRRWNGWRCRRFEGGHVPISYGRISDQALRNASKANSEMAVSYAKQATGVAAGASPASR